MPGINFATPQTPQTPNNSTFADPSFSFDFKPDVAELDTRAAIQTKLNRRLGPEYVSQRPAPGGGPKLTYVEGWKIIGLANEVFGYNGWSSSIISVTTDFVDMDEETRRFHVGVTAMVKITLKDGSHHDDVGYGTADNVKSKGAGLDKAKKEAVTDAVKRALRNFGNVLGLCLYEKAYAQEIAKIKVPPTKFDKSDLHHGPDRGNTPVPSTSTPAPPSGYTPQAPPQDLKLLSSVPPHLRNNMASGSGSSSNGRPNVPHTPAGSTARSAAPTTPAQSTTVNRAPVTRAPPSAAPAPQPAAPAPVPAPERRVTFAPEPQQPAPAAPRALAPVKSEQDLDMYFTASDDDAMMALDLDQFDEQLGGTSAEASGSGSNGNANGGAANGGGNFRPAGGSTRQPLQSNSAANGNGAGPSGPRVSNGAHGPSGSPTAGGFHFPNGATRSSGQNGSSSSSSGIGIKRAAESMQPIHGSRRPMPQQGMGLAHAQQQQQRQPFADLGVGAGGDVKRFKR